MCVVCKDGGQQECVRRVGSGDSWTKLRKKKKEKKAMYKKNKSLPPFLSLAGPKNERNHPCRKK